MNESYYDEVESTDNRRSQHEHYPHDINNQRMGYESSSTAHKEVSKTATKLKKKLAQFADAEVA